MDDDQVADHEGRHRRVEERRHSGAGVLPELLPAGGVVRSHGAGHAVREEAAVGVGGRGLRTCTMPRGRRVHVERRRVARPPQRLAGGGVERGHHLVVALAGEQVQAIADQHRTGVTEPDLHRPVPLQHVRPARRHVEGRRHAVARRPAPLRPVLRRRARDGADEQRHNHATVNMRTRDFIVACSRSCSVVSVSESATIVRVFDRRRESSVTRRSLETGRPNDRRYTPGMKTAVSIPDEIFEKVERLAEREKRTRSELYSAALREYVARHAPDESYRCHESRLR